MRQWLTVPEWNVSLLPLIWQSLRSLIDVGLVLALTYMMLVIIGERRTLWMVRGFIVLMLAAALSSYLSLTFLSFVLSNLLIGSAVAMAFILQSEFRRFWNNWDGVKFCNCSNLPAKLLTNLAALRMKLSMPSENCRKIAPERC